MNTVTRLASPSLAPLRRLTSVQRLLTVAAIGLSLPLLAACSSDSGSHDTSAAPVTGAASTAPPTDGFATPTIAANGDPFCDLAVQAQADAQQLDDTTSEFNTLLTSVVSGTAPVADLNAWGSTLYDIANSSATFYDDAAPYVAGTDAESDFVEMKGFVTAYSIPLAAMARDASDGEAFITEMSLLVQTSEVQSAITTGPAAAERVAAYITDRCPAEG
ncbi:MAG: hypothetical protein HGA51_02220 [Demequinaceae bacterium]|nr:hypothetical protein [Demequinaceae bacterium]